MEEQVKNIISRYIKIPAEQINAQTVIDRTTVASSIILHRMYAQLATEGFSADNYTEIKTYGQLSAALNRTGASAYVTAITNAAPVNEDQTSGVGIDIKSINAMPLVNDFRVAEFYKMNFSPEEIAYCILQTDPTASFAGLFAAKEAIIKADNAYRNHSFNTIIIDHLASGKPVHPGFDISISHTAGLAVAVVIKCNIASSPVPLTVHSSGSINSTLISFTAVTAFLLSLLTLLLFVFKSC